ncbi:hypothetical protein BDV93DRAFT_503838 [Ceratobasidium sp. AG-I]|nr:hypothetical protein BDV93DRAFT_503838 [Ceratobasidium sp. AG-I]
MGRRVNYRRTTGSPVPSSPRARSRGGSPDAEGRTHHCRFCTRSWFKATDLIRHELTHSSKKPHVCSHGICIKAFSQKTALVTHMNTHTGARPHKCRFRGCKSAFGDPSSRTRHEKETHNPGAGFKCAECGDTMKRKEQFKRHIRSVHYGDPDNETCEKAREHCAKTYKAKLDADKLARPTDDMLVDPVTENEETQSPPLRPRRNAVASTSQLVNQYPEDYEEEDDSARRISPMSTDYSYFDAATNHARTDSVESTDSRPSQYLENSQDSGFVDAFSPAYTRYDQTADHTLQYPSSQAGTPQSSKDYLVPGTAEHDAASEALLKYIRNPYRFPAGAGAYSISSPQAPASMPSPYVAASSPQVAMPVPRAPLPTEQSLFAQHHWSAAGSSWFPNDMQVDDMSRVPRAMSASMHPSAQGRQYLQQGRHHPYGRDRRERTGHAVQEHFVARTPEQDLPMVSNSFHGEPRIASSEPGSPEGMPLSLAGIHEHSASYATVYHH